MQALPDEVIFRQLMEAFDASQHFARSEVLRRQAALLERLVRHAAAQVPFYRDSGRLKPLFRADGTFNPAGWAEVPVLTRNEAKDNEEALQARVVPADMGGWTREATSGSTGTPLQFRRTRVQTIAAEAVLNRALKWHGVWPIQRVATPGSAARNALLAPGMYVLPGVADFRGHVVALRDKRVTHAIAPPSVAAAWAGHVEPGDRLSLTAVITTGEVLREEDRARIEAGLKTKVINLYSTSELGPIAIEGRNGRLVVNEETALLEAPPGGPHTKAPAPVILTPFYAYATPLIRYAPGDYARFSAATARHSPGLRCLDSVAGRQRNLLRRPDGSLFLPATILARDIDRILECRGWQLVQTGLTEMTFRIVVAGTPTLEQWARLEGWLRKALPEHRTTIAPVAVIENNLASGKAYEMFLSEID